VDFVGLTVTVVSDVISVSYAVYNFTECNKTIATVVVVIIVIRLTVLASLLD